MPGPVVQDAPLEMRRQEELDFDVEEPAGVVARPHVQDVQFVLGKILFAERIENLDGPDRDLRPQDCIEQMNQDVRIPLDAINALEGVVYFRVGSHCHGAPPW